MQAVIYDTNLPLAQNHVRGSIVVSISARHAEDPGSIPGRGVSMGPIEVGFPMSLSKNLFHGIHLRLSECKGSHLISKPAYSPKSSPW